jgi:hypothetical protein
MTAGGSYGTGGAAAGWYPDPQNPAIQRYWDGFRWTEHTALGAAQPAGPAAGKTRWGLIIGIVAGVMVIIFVALAAIAVPVFLNQKKKAEDAAAKADVSRLGIDINVWYVDHEGAPPAITVRGGYYYVDGVRSAMVSASVKLGGQTGTTQNDWCVWVTNQNGDLKDFQYTSDGLSSGRCARLGT